MIRCVMRYTQPNCKVELAKIRKITLFYKYICIIKNKVVLLQPNSKRVHNREFYILVIMYYSQINN